MIEKDNISNYERVRQKLSLGPLYAPKHKKVYELMRILWNDQEINVLSYFEGADKYNSLSELEKKSGIVKDELKAVLDRLYGKGTIAKFETEQGTIYSLLPLLPGIFEKYFIRSNDTIENLKK